MRDLFAEDDDGCLHDVALVERLVSEKLAAEAEKIKRRRLGLGRSSHRFSLEPSPRLPRRHSRLRPRSPMRKKPKPKLSRRNSTNSNPSPRRRVHRRSRAASQPSSQARRARRQQRQSIRTSRKPRPALLSASHDGTLLSNAAIPARGRFAAEQQSPAQRCSRFRPMTAIPTNAACRTKPASPMTPHPVLPIQRERRRQRRASRQAHDRAHRLSFAGPSQRARQRSPHRLSRGLARACRSTFFIAATPATTACRSTPRTTSLTAFRALPNSWPRKEIDARHAACKKLLPEERRSSGTRSQASITDSSEALFAHCAGLTINAVHEPHVRLEQAPPCGLSLRKRLNSTWARKASSPRAANYLEPHQKRRSSRPSREAKGEQDRRASCRSQEEGDGGRSRTAARRHRLAARAAAHAGLPRREDSELLRFRPSSMRRTARCKRRNERRAPRGREAFEESGKRDLERVRGFQPRNHTARPHRRAVRVFGDRSCPSPSIKNMPPRRAKRIAACDFDPHQDLATSITDLLVDLAHLCDAEDIDFVERVKKAINAWQVERIDPTSIADGPVVEIYIGTEGLPPKPKPVKRPDKRKKSRPA